MPKSFKRKFTTSKKSYKKKKSFRSSPSTLASSSSAVSSTKASHLSFKGSQRTLQPLPDTFKTWVTITNSGYWPAGAAQALSFSWAIDAIINPFNTVGGTGVAIPNPLVALNPHNPTGVENILYNAGTGTGIYRNYRVWRTKIQCSVQPEATGDTCQVALAPVNGTSSAYTTLNQISQAPNSVTKLVAPFTSGQANSFEANWSIPALYGIDDKQYAALNQVTGTATSPTYAFTGQWFAELGYQNSAQSVLGSKVPMFVKMQQHVEFFGRADTQLQQ